ncbi:MAG: SRPBCC domain-containing protein [Actinomycetota bacterium]
MSTRVVIERRIAAAPEFVWDFVCKPDRWLEWQGVEADIDPRPGGVHRVNIRGDAFAGGEVIEVVPNRRISFTWGFEIPEHPLPRGSTLVVIDLIPDGDGTLLRLTQERVPDGFEAVRHGWEHYLDRLVIVAEGGALGPDPNVGKPSTGPA